jgi:hypothetical protein
LDRPQRVWQGAAPVPEMQLLLACARREVGSEHKNEVRGLIRSGLDWQRVISLGAHHKMIPLLWWHLKSEVAAIPEHEAAALRRLFAWNARRMLQLSGERLEITRIFESGDISVVPYKGPALGVYLYGNLALRQAGDLDMLVSRRKVDRARDLLLHHGYGESDRMTPGRERGLRYSRAFAKEGIEVELHWSLTDGETALPLDFEAMETRLRILPLGGGQVRMFAKEDALLVLCAEGAKHRWNRLEWLCGVAELLRTHSSDLDWDAAIRGAASVKVQRMLFLGVLMAHELLNAPVPGEVLRSAQSDHRVEPLARAVPLLFLIRPPEASAADGEADELFRSQLRERPLDRIRFAWRRFAEKNRA